MSLDLGFLDQENKKDTDIATPKFSKRLTACVS